jgi:hypothetical protein
MIKVCSLWHTNIRHEETDPRFVSLSPDMYAKAYFPYPFRLSDSSIIAKPERW